MKAIKRYKAIIITCIGSVAEWLEFSAYLYLAPRLAHLFFPDQEAAAGLVSVFGLFAIAYVARPIGGFIFGYLGDRYGRRLTLTLSVLIMAMATTGIGLLPTWDQIGIWAPLLLLACRVMQGMAVTGEFTNAAVFMIEQSRGNPCLAGTWANWSANLGIALGALTTALVSLPTMPDWAWRIPFLISCTTSLLALLIRRKLFESPSFNAAAAKSLSPKKVLTELFLHHKHNGLVVILISAFAGVTLYVGNMFWCSYVVSHHYFTPSKANMIASVDIGVEFLMLPLMAIVAYRAGIRRVMIAGLLLTASATLLNFYLAAQGCVLTSMLTMIMFATGVATFEAPMFKLLFDLFPARIRCTGIALAWAMGQSLFSGPSPMLAQWLSDHYGWVGGVFCILLVCGGGLVAMYMHPAPHKTPNTQAVNIASS
ncbi:MFS transporter [Kistimonas asteriae]|uniref:MFS transporter n=1 Tax=Kistimonas asteriae TaxID=517724 RepID=UPI001BA90ECE|nr:MFS transporter [Kistimonas asteriae]